jgi:hypothetical protein
LRVVVLLLLLRCFVSEMLCVGVGATRARGKGQRTHVGQHAQGGDERVRKEAKRKLCGGHVQQRRRRLRAATTALGGAQRLYNCKTQLKRL